MLILHLHCLDMIPTFRGHVFVSSGPSWPWFPALHMELGQAGDVELFCSSGRHFVCHRRTGEVVQLPDGQWQLAFDDQGLAVLWTGADAVFNASEFLQYTLVHLDEDSPAFVLDQQQEESSPELLQTFHSDYKGYSITLTPSGCTSGVEVPLYRFKHRISGASLWWDVCAIRKSFVVGKAASSWLYSWWRHWLASCEGLGLHIPHLRLSKVSRQQCNRDGEYLLWRCLPCPTLSTYALVAVLSRLCKPQVGQHRADKNGEHVEAWTLFARALFHRLGGAMPDDWVFMMDPNVVVRPRLPFGGVNPLACVYHKGHIDLRALLDEPLGEACLRRWGYAECEKVDVVNLLVKASSKVDRWFFMQLVWHLASMCEESFLETVSDVGAAGGEPARGAAHTVGKTATRWLKSREDGGRNARMYGHLLEGRKVFEVAREINISCCFDASRVGGKSRLLGAVCAGNRLAWTPPQVIRPQKSMGNIVPSSFSPHERWFQVGS